ncbi:MAG: DMT family transporter [Ignavibacteriales bacterium]
MEFLGLFAALVSAASWALGSILFKIIGEKVSPSGTTFAKGAVGVLLLGTAYIISGIESIPLQSILLFCISGIVGITIGDTLFFASLQDLGPKVQIILFMLGQGVTAILAMLITKEMPLASQWIGILLTLVGVSLILWDKFIYDQQNQNTNIRGVITGLGAMFCFSISLIMIKEPLGSTSTIGAAFLRMAAGTLGIFIYGLLKNQIPGWVRPFKDMKLAATLLGAVCVIVFGGFWQSLVALKYLKIAIASTLCATEPLFVLPLAYLILKEKVSQNEILAAALTVSGVFLLINSFV